MAALAVVSNAALICFSTNTFTNPHVNDTWLFIIIQWVGFSVMVILSSVIPDETYAVRIQVPTYLPYPRYYPPTYLALPSLSAPASL